MGGTLADTDDLVQESSSGRLRGSRSSSLAAWAPCRRTCGRPSCNRIRDELRQKGRAPEAGELGDLEADSAESPLELAIGREALDRYERRWRRFGRRSGKSSSGGSKWATPIRNSQTCSASPFRGGQKGRRARADPSRRRDGPCRANEPLADLARKVLDGAPVDWAAAESSASHDERPVVRQLRLIEGLAAVHRREPSQARTRTSTPALFSTAPPVEVPRQWGHLRILERIGRGAFRRGYRAWDSRLDREVALKLLPAPRDPRRPLIDDHREAGCSRGSGTRMS